MAERVKPYRARVNYWLLATDPGEYSYDNLDADGTTVWNGVTDYLDLKHLRDIQEDDGLLIFHTGDEPAIVGLAHATSDPYPDPGQADPTTYVMDVDADGWLEVPVRLADLQADPEFRDFDLVNQPDLSVLPVPEPLWNRILEKSRVPVGERV